MDALEAIRAILGGTCPARDVLETEPYANNLRCVLRLITNVLFLAEYRCPVLAYFERVESSENGPEHIWPSEIMEDMKHIPIDLLGNTEYLIVKRKIVNYIRRDSNTIAKCVVLPMMDGLTFRFMFPTFPPATLQPSHLYCPLGKAFAFFKWCHRHAGIHEIRLNEELVSGGLLSCLFDIRRKMERVDVAISFVEDGGDIFGPETVQKMLQFRQHLLSVAEQEESIAPLAFGQSIVCELEYQTP